MIRLFEACKTSGGRHPEQQRGVQVGGESYWLRVGDGPWVRINERTQSHVMRRLHAAFADVLYSPDNTEGQ